MKHFALFVLLVTGIFISHAQTKMTHTEISQFKKAVQTEAQKTKTIRADFEEAKYVKVLKNSSKSSGVFKFKNDQLLWQYQTPKKNALLFAANKMKIKNEKGKVSSIDLTKNKRFKQLQQLMVGSYNGNIFDETNFTIEYYKDATTKWAVLKPKSKDMSKHIKEVTFWFKNGENTVSEIKIKENNDDYSIITLKNKKFNAIINDSEFQL